MTDRGEELLQLFESLYQSRLDAGEPLRAARAAFWLGFRLSALGEMGRAGAWMATARHLIEGAGQDCVERGYLLLAEGHQHVAAGDLEAALRTAAAAATTAERFGDADLLAFARNQQGRVMAHYLEAYAAYFRLPVRHRTRVDGLSRPGDRYLVTAGGATLAAEHVVVAMTSYQQPRAPAFATALDRTISAKARCSSSARETPAPRSRWSLRGTATGYGCRAATRATSPSGSPRRSGSASWSRWSSACSSIAS